jgi:hypothetical protein
MQFSFFIFLFLISGLSLNVSCKGKSDSSSNSSINKICELELLIAENAASLNLYLTDKVTPIEDSEVIIAYTGGNPDRKNCDDLELDLNERELTVILSGAPTPIPINIIRLPSAE